MAKKYVDVDEFAEAICDFPAIDEHSANAVISLLRRQPTADVVEIEMLRDWLWEIALNSVGCDFVGDFSIACQDIISRLDGLKRFAEERRTDNEWKMFKNKADYEKVKHARWKGAGMGDYECTNCWEVFSGGNKFKRCPNCGAIMDAMSLSEFLAGSERRADNKQSI